ncbi:DUF6663 family protein [Halopelagius longus]|uniref:Uncharacterized protein n=1 Tax=Halopelagius longus TaxID=1236180 RepID=A0A1H1DMN4_9EURY|nr:DUF6663 family protein [Halopelagius longus]RDI71396.1 hypothetical protein DWB78_06460 [Halopelagius longus]SDQ77794.1 hypothetical protein SAMN05216278_2490 [Halopelagius longus]
MDLTTTGRYRVLGRPRDPEELLLIDVDIDAEGDAETDSEADSEAFGPTYVAATGYDGELGEEVASLEAGNLVDARLSWRDGDPRFESVEVVAETTFEFLDGVTGMFEAAKETWWAAEADGEAMNSRVTRDTDGEPNGALYVFAKQSGARDLFAEFKSGVTPLEPLVERANEGEERAPEAEQPRAVFVLRPADEPFIAVYIAFRRDGMLARTVRDTYA